MSRALKLTALAVCIILSSAAPAKEAKGNGSQTSQTAIQPPKGKLRYLNPRAFVPRQLVAAPPASGSKAEMVELAQLHKLIAGATPERIARARWDGDHENPTAFNEITGRDLRTLPATWGLLTIVQSETDAVIDEAKVYFHRRRPWGSDPTLPYCDRGRGKAPTLSYPSGHSGMGYSVGWTLAQLMPDRASEILARAQDYAVSREICGVHYPSDTEASHVIGTLTAATLLSDRRLAVQVAAARAELRRR